MKRKSGGSDCGMEWRGGGERNVKDVASRRRVAKRDKKRNIALRSEEMRIKRRKKITTQQQGPLIQFSLLLFSVI